MEKKQNQQARDKKQGKARLLWLLWLTFSQVVVRLAALCPAALYFMKVSPGGVPSEIWLALSLILYLLLVMPLRFYAGEGLVYASGFGEKAPSAVLPYGDFLRHGMARFFRGLLWGLPFIAGVSYFVIGTKTMSYTQMWQPIQRLGLLLFNRESMQEGMLTAALLIAVFLILFIFGWQRDLMMEYLPVRGRRVKETLSQMRRLRRCRRGQRAMTLLTNFLLTLPALMAFAGVIIPYLQENVYFSSNLQITIRSLTKLMETPLPSEFIALLVGALVVLYLPLCVIRKLRNARLTVMLQQACAQEEKKHAA